MNATQEKPRIRVGPLGGLGGTGIPMPGHGGSSRGVVRSEFMRGGNSPVFRGWNPALRDSGEDVRLSYLAASARASDIVQNSGWVAGAIDQANANTVGVGLRLSHTPDAAGIGMTREAAAKWAREVERRFELWANNAYECDIEGKRSFGQMQGAAFKAWFLTGEIIAEFPWKRRPGGTYGTKTRVIQAHRLTQRTDELSRLYQGVRVDQDGLPVSYVFNKRSPGGTPGIFSSVGSGFEQELAARDRYGRVRVAHVFDGLPGQMRGITPLVPALQVARQFDQLSDATLTAALIRAVFAATIKSTEPTEEVMKGLLTPQEQARMASEGLSTFEAWAAAQEGWYKGTHIDLGIKGRFAHLFPGQTLEFHANEGAASDYKDQALFLLRELLRCLGLTYESGTGDYSNATYSSVRMATGEIYLITVYRRRNVVSPFCQAGFECWLEESIDKGETPFPGGIDGFLEKKTAACRAAWKGTPKVQADDLKTAKAHQVYKDMRVITDEQIANELGMDVEDLYEQLAREMEMRKLYKIPEAVETPIDPTAEALLAGKE